MNELNFEVESELIKQGFDLVVGIDEVGRGSLAGPMYMAGYISSPRTQIIRNVNDSKKLSKVKRELIQSRVNPDDYYICASSNIEIDNIGLGAVLKKSLSNIINFCRIKFSDKKIKFLVDGQFAGEWENDVEFIVKGDSKVYSIAIASIVAKVLRDKLMFEYNTKYPEYEFDRNVGYGTAKHLKAIQTHGLSHLHRRSFRSKI